MCKRRDKSKVGLNEPYATLSYILELDEIIKVERLYRGRQIKFKKWIDIDDSKGKYDELIEIVGKDKTREILMVLGGNSTYFPALAKDCVKEIYRQVKKDFTGYNYAELAKKYGYSERHIRRIVDGRKKGKSKRKKKVNKRLRKDNAVMEGQMSIFDFLK